MELWQAIVLGIVQGLTEFLPISSSAHVSVAGRLFGDDPGAFFTAVTQLGTETAVVVVLWKDIARLLTAWWKGLWDKEARKSDDSRVAWLVIIGSIPIVVLALLFEDFITAELRNLWVTASMLMIFAVLLAFADRKAKEIKPIERLTWRDGIILGFWQSLALIPGVSRSGGTITGGLLLGYKREAATRYSFLLAIPAVFGSGFYSLFKSVTEPQPAGDLGLGPTILATVVAFVIGYLVIRWLLQYISTHNFSIFVWYRLGFGALLMVLLATGVLTP